MEEMEYTTMPQIAERLEDRWEQMDGASPRPAERKKTEVVVDD